MTATAQPAPAPHEFSSDGLRCRGWLYEPAGDPPYPCVLLAHGFGGSPRGPLDGIARRIVEAGLAAFTFDFRHFGASAGSPRHLLKVESQLEDWRAALGYVRALEVIDGDRIGLWGSSFTGGQVIALAANEPDVRATVAQVPYVDGYALARAAGLRHILRVAPALLRDTLQTKLLHRSYVIQALGPPGSRAAFSTRYADLFEAVSQFDAWENRVSARSLLGVYRFRPVLLASKIKTPLLVVVTYEDKVAPASAAIRAVHDLPYAEMAMFSGRHFDLYAGDVAQRAHDTEARFLAQHLREPLALGAGA